MSAIVPPTVKDRLLAGFRALVRNEIPTLTFFGIYEYAIQRATPTTIDASPVDPSLSLPTITGIVLRPSILGESVTPTIGSLCLVQFVNGDPTRPICTSCNPLPTKAAVDAIAEIDIGATCLAVNVGLATSPVALASAIEAWAAEVVIECAHNVPPIVIPALTGASSIRLKSD